MFREGKTVEDIAVERNLAISTIEGHLSSFVRTGEIAVGELVPEEKVKVILPLIQEIGEGSLSTVKHQLSNDYTYGEIRAVLNHYLLLKSKK
ncbi:MAG: helix-turn-helix domain-containing protein [Candidatus Azobacteroides sp.]|nr:helix-turn-helix domain-containing protein [Candidatus Azobacteroides sp.]